MARPFPVRIDMPCRSLKILLLYDVPYAPDNHREAHDFMRGSEWRDERDVCDTLARLGHAVTPFGVFDDIQALVATLARQRFDVVFNLCESFRNDRAGESNIPALLQLMGVPCTGAGPTALALCKDKGLSKQILSYHHVGVPRFAIARRGELAARSAPVINEFVYPGICKPLGLDASIGIARSSLVAGPKACAARVRFLHERLKTDAIIEEFIDGRELYVGVFGNDHLTVLPPQELVFRRLPPRTPRVLTYKAKWDHAYRRRYGIGSRAAPALERGLATRLQTMCEEIYRVLKITGYARIDLRQRGDDFVCLEVNPNPSIKRCDDFATAARNAGLSYGELINRLVHLPLTG